MGDKKKAKKGGRANWKTQKIGKSILAVKNRCACINSTGSIEYFRREGHTVGRVRARRERKGRYQGKKKAD